MSFAAITKKPHTTTPATATRIDIDTTGARPSTSFAAPPNTVMLARHAASSHMELELSFNANPSWWGAMCFMVNNIRSEMDGVNGLHAMFA
jgi:hypothetical protein